MKFVVSLQRMQFILFSGLAYIEAVEVITIQWLYLWFAEGQASSDGKRGESVRNKWPKVAPEIMRIASERHQKGLMSPWIYQVLSQGELKIDITLEEEANRELPSAIELYRPIRQNVYAVLHDLNKKRLIAKNNPSQLPGKNWYYFTFAVLICSGVLMLKQHKYSLNAATCGA